jgi:hypothetical protein
MLFFRGDLAPHHWQNIHTALENEEQALRAERNEKEAFKFQQTREQVEEQLQRQGVQFVK